MCQPRLRAILPSFASAQDRAACGFDALLRKQKYHRKGGNICLRWRQSNKPLQDNKQAILKMFKIASTRKRTQ